MPSNAGKTRSGSETNALFQRDAFHTLYTVDADTAVRSPKTHGAANHVEIVAVGGPAFVRIGDETVEAARGNGSYYPEGTVVTIPINGGDYVSVKSADATVPVIAVEISEK